MADPIGDFLATRRPARQPLESDLEGTVFDAVDPVAAWKRERDLNAGAQTDTMGPIGKAIGGVMDWGMSPFKVMKAGGEFWRDKALDWAESDPNSSYAVRALKTFPGAVAEEIGNMGPFGYIANLTGPGALGKIGTAARAITGGVAMGAGTGEAIEGYQEGDSSKFLGGAGTAAMGALGVVPDLLPLARGFGDAPETSVGTPRQRQSTPIHRGAFRGPIGKQEGSRIGYDRALETGLGDTNLLPENAGPDAFGPGPGPEAPPPAPAGPDPIRAFLESRNPDPPTAWMQDAVYTDPQPALPPASRPNTTFVADAAGNVRPNTQGAAELEAFLRNTGRLPVNERPLLPPQAGETGKGVPLPPTARPWERDNSTMTPAQLRESMDLRGGDPLAEIDAMLGAEGLPDAGQMPFQPPQGPLTGRFYEPELPNVQNPQGPPEPPIQQPPAESIGGAPRRPQPRTPGGAGGGAEIDGVRELASILGRRLGANASLPGNGTYRPEADPLPPIQGLEPGRPAGELAAPGEGRLDEGGSPRNGNDGSRLPEAASEDVDPLAIFRRRQPQENVARLTPQIRREIENMLDDMESLDYEDKIFNEGGNGKGGDFDSIRGRRAGAPVYYDILGESPLNQTSKKGGKGTPAQRVRGERQDVINALRAILQGNDIPDNIAEGAVRLAERRAKGDWKGLNQPLVPYRDGVDTRTGRKFTTELPDEIPDELSRLIDQYAGDESAAQRLDAMAMAGEAGDSLAPAFEDQLKELERALGDSSIEEAADGPFSINGSGDSAASGEALSRNSGMRDRGEQFVVYDRAGNKRPLIGPDAVDYVAKKGETYGIEGPDGFRPLDDQGGRVAPRKPEPTVPGAGGVAVEEPAAGLRTASGRTIEPPALNEIRSPRTAKNAIAKTDDWLLREALAEAAANGDEFQQTIFGQLNPKRLSQGDRDALNEYLFGDPDGVRLDGSGAQEPGALNGRGRVDITRPLAPTSPEPIAAVGDAEPPTPPRSDREKLDEIARLLMGRDGEGADLLEGIRKRIDTKQNSAFQLAGMMRAGKSKFHKAAIDAFDELEATLAPEAQLGDVLDTGEVQPRLPEAGKVREQNVSTPEFEAPFSLDGGADTTRREVQRGIFDAPADDLAELDRRLKGSEDAAQPPAVSDDSLTDLEQILTRHEVRNPGKADEIAQSMERVGWKGRPVLVINDGGKRTAWTATHRLEAAKRAGLTPDDVPMMEIDAEQLRAAGYDLDSLTGKGKNARIKALRDAGLNDAADLLEQEKAASTARNEAAAEGVPESKAGLPPNVRDFLTRQLKYTREQVDAMAPEEARRIGRERVMNSEPAEPVEPSSPPPQPLRERKQLPGDRALASFDQLRGARGQQRKGVIQRTAVPNEQAEFGASTTPVKSPQERHNAGEKLTSRERTMLGLPEETRERGRVSLREQGNSPRQIERRVTRMAKWINDPTPENFAKWAEEASDQAERWNEKALKGGTGEEAPPKKDADTGEYLASGIFPGAQIFSDPKLLKKVANALLTADPQMRTIRAVMGGAIGAWSNDDNRLRGMFEGALLGAYAGPIARGVAMDLVARMKGGVPKHLAEVYLKRGDRDLSLWERYMSPPPSAIREYYKQVEPAIGAWDKVRKTGKVDANTPLLQQRISKTNKQGKPVLDQPGFLAPERKYLRDEAVKAREAGKTRLASYLEAFHDDLAGVMTKAEKGMLDNLGMSPKRANYYANEVANQIYRAGLAFNAASAIVNRISQPLLAVPYVGVSKIWKAYAVLSDSEKLLADIHRPVDAEEMRVAASRTLAKFDEMASWMMRFTDNQNRQGVAAAAHLAAKSSGAPQKVAEQFARDVAEKTQGLIGIGTSNPSWRGPVMKMFKPFTKFPTLLAEWANDIAVHPDPRVRLRTAAMLAGVYAFSRATGVDAWDMLAGGARWGGSAIIRGAMDTYAHLTNNSPDHSFAAMPGSGFLDSDAGNLLYPVGARKTVETARRFYDYGLGTHKKRTPGGSLEEVSALEDAANYFGIKSTRQTDRQETLNRAFEQEKTAQNADAQESAQVKRDYYAAHDRGDDDAAAEALSKMGPNTRRSVIRGQDRDRFQRLLHDTPVKRRGDFIDNYGELEKELGLK